MKVKWPFLQKVLCMGDFDPKWCAWVNDFLQGANVGIRVKHDFGHYFQTRKELRWGDMLSLVLSNDVADMLSTLIGREK
jgi:hypothetical protein